MAACGQTERGVAGDPFKPNLGAEHWASREAALPSKYLAEFIFCFVRWLPMD